MTDYTCESSHTPSVHSGMNTSSYLHQLCVKSGTLEMLDLPRQSSLRAKTWEIILPAKGIFTDLDFLAFWLFRLYPSRSQEAHIVDALSFYAHNQQDLNDQERSLFAHCMVKIGHRDSMSIRQICSSDAISSDDSS